MRHGLTPWNEWIKLTMPSRFLNSSSLLLITSMSLHAYSSCPFFKAMCSHLRREHVIRFWIQRLCRWCHNNFSNNSPEAILHGKMKHLVIYCFSTVKVKLYILVPSVGITEVTKRLSNVKHLVMTLKRWGPLGIKPTPPDCSSCKAEDYTTMLKHFQYFTNNPKKSHKCIKCDRCRLPWLENMHDLVYT